MCGYQCATRHDHRHPGGKRRSAAPREHLCVHARDGMCLHDLENRAFPTLLPSASIDRSPRKTVRPHCLASLIILLAVRKSGRSGAVTVNSMASSRTRSRQVGARKKPKRRTPINAIDESTTHQIRMKRCRVVPFGRSAFECNLGSKRCAAQVVCVGVGWGVESPQGTLPFVPLLPPPTVALQAPARFHTIYSARAAFSRGTGISRNEFSLFISLYYHLVVQFWSFHLC